MNTRLWTTFSARSKPLFRLLHVGKDKETAAKAQVSNYNQTHNKRLQNIAKNVRKVTIFELKTSLVYIRKPKETV